MGVVFFFLLIFFFLVVVVEAYELGYETLPEAHPEALTSAFDPGARGAWP